MCRLLTILLSCAFLTAFGQNEINVWYFGEKTGLDFNSGSPVPLFNSSMRASEGCASICDKEGNLLFYTNGVAIWNRSHEVMDNGYDLNGNISSTQSSIIIPHPGNDSLYYVFVVDNHGGPKGISYSIININSNNGLGKVISRNIILTESTTEKITAVHGCNNKEVWLLVRLWNSNRYYSFRIGKSGIDTDPVISFTPNTLTGHIWGTLGSMKFSPNSVKVAAAHGWSISYIELGNFSRLTGDVSNVEKLFVSPPGFTGFETGPYGLEFSPDSRYLYVYAAYGGARSFIYQFNLNYSTIAEIQNSRLLVAELNYPYAGSMQLGPDQKIYITNSFDSSLSVIHQPNNAAPFCNFEYGAVSLGRRVALGLPNFIQSYTDPDFSAGDFSATNCEIANLNFIINRPGDISSVKWDFGDPASGILNNSSLLTPSHSYSANGFYTVTLIAYRSCSIDTIRKKIYSGNLILGLNDSYQGCNEDSLQLSVPYYEGVRYNWSNGSRSPVTKIITGGKYKITVKAGCSFSDSANVVFYDKPLLTLGPDKTICTNEQVLIDPFLNNVYYLWNTGAVSSSININKTGQYWLKATNLTNACFTTDTINIKDKPFPRLWLGSDTLICETEELLLRTGLENNGTGLHFLWQDGSTNSTFRVRSPGLFAVQASNDCTVKSDTIKVTFKVCPLGIPNAFSPNGDGRNDRFRIKYGEGITKYHIQIFNRFGQKVFESRDQLIGWDGTVLGKPQPMGTYGWVVQYIDGLTEKLVSLKGTVTLVR